MFHSLWCLGAQRKGMVIFMELYPAFHISPKLLEAAQRAEELARPQFAEIESIQRYLQQ